MAGWRNALKLSTQNNHMPEIKTASVKVMRSHDYCHFEVVLGTSDADLTTQQIDDLRKTAARLADKAVAQYVTAKEAEAKRTNAGYSLARYAKECEPIEAKPEEERTPEEKATLKHFRDLIHFSRRHYDYEDEWDNSDWDEHEWEDEDQSQLPI
jgi:hypothetical protein